ncbi:MAG: hypothetical protein MO852_16945, partial [Candidatus Devosia euplotis]|nr:hypothetical protein [Candidatus Devosia euplotis]
MLGPSSALLGAFGLAPPPGSINPLYGRNGIIALFGVQHAPIVFITLRAGLAQLPRDYVEATRAAGVGRWRWPMAGAGLACIVLILVLPLTALIFTSLVPVYGVPLDVNTVTLANYVEVPFRQNSTARAFINSGYLSVCAALILMVIAVPLAIGLLRLPLGLRRAAHGALDPLYALPGIVLAIACILLFLRPLPVIGSLYNTPWIILVAYVMRFAALALKPGDAALQQVPPPLLQAAAASGA